MKLYVYTFLLFCMCCIVKSKWISFEQYFEDVNLDTANLLRVKPNCGDNTQLFAGFCRSTY